MSPRRQKVSQRKKFDAAHTLERARRSRKRESSLRLCGSNRATGNNAGASKSTKPARPVNRGNRSIRSALPKLAQIHAIWRALPKRTRIHQEDAIEFL